MMWIMIFLMMAVGGIAGFVYVVLHMIRFAFLRKYSKKKAVLFSCMILFAVMGVLLLWGGLWNAMTIFIHLLLFWLFSDLIFHFIPVQKYYAGMLAIAVTAVYIGYGVFTAQHVVRTSYAVDAPEDFRIVLFSDAHMGTVFDSVKLQEYAERMNQENPDIVILAGDFVDDDTSYEEMVQSCEALSLLKTKYGVYYVFGNHDAGYSNTRGYGYQELKDNLIRNGVHVLEDQTVSLTDQIALCGRLDTKYSRKSMAELEEQFPENSFVIVADHEPNDQKAQQEAGVGLGVSGHTHGGQVFPLGPIGVMIGANDMVYGKRIQDQTTFIVSSGIADWAFKYRTGCVSEYVVIDLVEYETLHTES